VKEELNKNMLGEVFWGFAKSGGFQRSWIYKPTSTEEQRSEFRHSLKIYLYKRVFLRFDCKIISEKQLIDTIDRLVSLNSKNIALNKNQLKYGNAQKFVNLYLKGMWICGRISTPPHFPLDRVILRKLRLSANWTNMDRENYLNAIKIAKQNLDRKKFPSIAEWERCIYLNEYIESKNK
jgi:hypothetical protein